MQHNRPTRPRLPVLACALATVIALSACEGISVRNDSDDVEGGGTVVTESREVASFDRITLAGEGSVIITEGTEASLSIETDDNLLAYIETTVGNGTLTIATESGIDIDPTEGVVYRVTTPRLAGLTLTGAGSFQMAEHEAERFSVSLSGAGDIDVDRLIADELAVTISGAGSVTVAGEVAHQDITIPGSGSYFAVDLRSRSAAVTTSGVGSATVWVTDELDAELTGVGSIDYYGSPRVTESVSGVGAITDRGDHEGS